MTKNLVTVALLFFGFSHARAGDVPEVPPEDSMNKYYLGVSDRSESIKDGLREAFEQAVQEAIRENYGFVTRLEADSYVSDQESRILRRFRQSSGEIALKGFVKVRSKIENVPGRGYTISAIYRYSKKDIDEERLRMSAAIAERAPAFSEAGGPGRERLGGVQISTVPLGARVFLDDESYLRTPLRVLNQLPPGIHRLKIDHPEYETIEEEIVITAGGITKIDKNLRPALGSVTLDTTPSGATVRIDGRIAGQTPLAALELRAGVPVRIDFERADSFPMTVHGYAITKERGQAETFELKRRPRPKVVEASVENLEPAVGRPFYFSVMGNIESLTHPLERSRGDSADASSSSSTLVGANLELGIGFTNSLGVTYAVGRVTGEGTKSYGGGEGISAADRVKFGIVMNRRIDAATWWHYGAEFETMSAEISSRRMTGPVYPYVFDKFSAVLTGRGLFVGAVFTRDGFAAGLKFGLMDYASSDARVRAGHSVFMGLGFGASALP